MVVDAHSHYIPKAVAEHTTFYKIHWSDIDNQIRLMDGLGVDKAVLLYPTSDAHINMGSWQKVCFIYNEEIAKIQTKFGNRFVGAGIVPVDNQDLMLKELSHIRDLGLGALSLASSYDGKFLDDKIFFGLYKEVEKLNMPIFVHSQIINPIGFERVNDPLLMPVVEYLFDITMCMGKLMMSDIFQCYKNTKFIFAHFAGVAPFLKDRFDSTYSMLRGRNFVKDLRGLPSAILKNIYVDTSGVTSKEIFECALNMFDKNKILWGSDYPANKHIKESLEVLDSLSLSSEEKAGILGNNVLSII